MDKETRDEFEAIKLRLLLLESIVLAPVEEIDPIERGHQEFAAKCRARQDEI